MEAAAGNLIVREELFGKQAAFEPCANGRLRVRFTLGRSIELKRWIMGFGAEVEVMEPKELRDAVAEECRKIRERA